MFTNSSLTVVELFCRQTAEAEDVCFEKRSVVNVGEVLLGDPQAVLEVT